jgi:hypothetical protein
MVAVAQLVESRIVIPVVVGSNPISHPILLSSAIVSTKRLLSVRGFVRVFHHMYAREMPSLS